MRFRLFVLLLVPSIALTVLAGMVVTDRNDAYNDARTASAIATLAGHVAQLDDALGEEAIASTLVLDDARLVGRDLAHTDDLDARRAETDELLLTLEQSLQDFAYDPDVASAALTVRMTLDYRGDVMNGTISPLQVADRYRYIRSLLLDALSTQTGNGAVARGNDSIIAVIALIEARSAHLDERLGVQLALQYELWAPGQHSAAVAAIIEQQQHLDFADNFLANSSAPVLPWPALVAVRDTVILTQEVPELTAEEWLAISDRWLGVLEAKIAAETQTIADRFAAEEAEAASSRIATVLGVFGAMALALLVTSVVSIRLVRRVSRVTVQARGLALGTAPPRSELKVRGTDQIAQLATAFDDTSYRIEQWVRMQTLESNVLEAIAQGSPIDDVLDAIAPLLGTDSDEAPLFRFELAPVSNSTLVQLGDDLPGLWYVPVSAEATPTEPSGVAVRTAIGLATMAVRRAADDALLAHQARYDALTGLLNRRAILEDADSVVAALGPGAELALVYVDLDGFKATNDQFGHRAGDAILTAQGQRMLQAADEVDGFAGRLGGDEFLLIIPGIETESSLRTFVDNLVDALARPVSVDQFFLDCGASIGGALARYGVGALELLQEADTALYEAKRTGRGTAVVSNVALRQKTSAFEGLKRAFCRALDTGEFMVWYQPIFSDDGATLAGFEALARWDRPGTGFVSPGQFLPVAEELRLMSEFDANIFSLVCDQVASWQDHGLDAPPVHINISSRRLEDPDFVADTLETLRLSGCPTTAVVIEVTESGLMTDTRSNAHRLQELRNVGVEIACDDFGQGYSSLAYLRDLPVDVLKIDRHFVDHVDQSETNQAIIRAIHDLAIALGMDVIAEGIEREEERAYLASIGCSKMQGYFLGRPSPAIEASALIAKHRSRIARPESEDWLAPAPAASTEAVAS